MKEKKKLSLTGQLIITMVAIVAGTVVLCLFFNSTFLTKYYVFHKQKELHSGFERVQLICWEKGEASDEEIESLEEASALKDISHMPARVKCAELAWRTLEEMLQSRK